MARTLIERGFDPERIVKIYNGMDFDRPEGEFDRVAYLRTPTVPRRGRRRAVRHCRASDRRQGILGDHHPRLCRGAEIRAAAALFIAGDGEDETCSKSCVRPARRARARDILRLGIAGHAVLPRDGYQPAVLGVRNLPVFHSGGRLCRLRDHLLGCRRYARAHRHRRERLYLSGRGR